MMGKWEYDKSSPDNTWPWSKAWGVNNGVRTFELDFIVKPQNQYETKFRGDIPPQEIRSFISFICAEVLQSHFEEGEVVNAFVNQKNVRIQINHVFHDN